MRLRQFCIAHTHTLIHMRPQKAQQFQAINEITWQAIIVARSPHFLSLSQQAKADWRLTKGGMCGRLSLLDT